MQYEEEGDSDKAAVPSDITDTKQQQGRVRGDSTRVVLTLMTNTDECRNEIFSIDKQNMQEALSVLCGLQRRMYC